MNEAMAPRLTVNKHTEQVEVKDPGDEERPEDDCFEFEVEENEVEVQKFGAVKPWIGAVKEPADHPQVNKAAPD